MGGWVGGGGGGGARTVFSESRKRERVGTPSETFFFLFGFLR